MSVLTLFSSHQGSLLNVFSQGSHTTVQSSTPTVVLSTHQVSSAVIVAVTISFSKTTRTACGAAMPINLCRIAFDRFVITAIHCWMCSISAVVASTHQLSKTFAVLVAVSSVLKTRIRLSAATPVEVCRIVGWPTSH